MEKQAGLTLQVLNPLFHAKDIEKTVNTTIEQALQGRAAGVYVTQNSGQPGGGISVNIRGISSLGRTQPFYVIDGVQMQVSEDVSFGSSSSSNPLSGLNPCRYRRYPNFARSFCNCNLWFPCKQWCDPRYYKTW